MTDVNNAIVDSRPPKRDLQNFTKAINSMTNSSLSYERYANAFEIERQLSQQGNYDISDVRHIIENGSFSERRALSRKCYESNGFYKEIITHYATLLKYAGLTIPNPDTEKTSLQDVSKALQKRYYSAITFIDNLDLEVLGPRIAQRVLIDGIYYGAIQSLDKKHLNLIDLPFDYCRSRFVDERGNLLVEFNVSFFNSISSKSDKDATLKTYPKVISSYYRKWERNPSKNSSWLLLPSTVGVAFKLLSDTPYFLSVVPATMEYDMAVENELKREVAEIKKLIVHKIPHLNDGTLLLEPDEVNVVHKSVVNMVKDKNPNDSVLTTYGEVDVHSLQSSEAASNSALKTLLQGAYATAGVSGEIFAASGSSSLGTSLANDTSLMMTLANKISVFLTSILNRQFATGTINFDYMVLPITHHNWRDCADTYLKLASSGYSLLLPAIASGLSQKQLISVKKLENDWLGLDELLIPPQTAYTQSGKDAEEESGGRPVKKELEKTKKTNDNIKSKEKTGGQ